MGGDGGGEVGGATGSGSIDDGDEDDTYNDTDAKPHPLEDVPQSTMENSVPTVDIISNESPPVTIASDTVVTDNRVKHKPALLPTPLTKPLISCTPPLSTATSLSSSWPHMNQESSIPSTLSLPSMKGGVVGGMASPRKGKKEEGWKEVSKRYTM